jgi:sodium/potassium-transporting ATPase subunit alpha
MFVTEGSIATKKMTPKSARDWVVKIEGTTNVIHQLRSLADLCNAGEFDAPTNHLPLSERKITGDATDQAVLRLSESLGPSETYRGCG